MYYHVKASEELVELIKERFTEAELSMNLKWFTSAASLPDAQSIVEIVMQHLTGESVQKTQTFDNSIWKLKRISNWNISHDESQALKEAINLAGPFRDQKDGPTPRRQILMPDQGIEDYINSLTTQSEKILSILGLCSGCVPNEYLRDQYGLFKAHQGLIRVGKKLNSGTSRSRWVRFKPDLLEKYDPDREVIGILRNKIFTRDNAAMIAANELTPILADAPLNFYQLRASFAIRRHVNDGADWQTIADELGIQRKHLINTVKKYAVPNNLELKY